MSSSWGACSWLCIHIDVHYWALDLVCGLWLMDAALILNPIFFLYGLGKAVKYPQTLSSQGNSSVSVEFTQQTRCGCILMHIWALDRGCVRACALGPAVLALCTPFQVPGVEQISAFQVLMVRNIWIFSFPEVLETSGKQKLARWSCSFGLNASLCAVFASQRRFKQMQWYKGHELLPGSVDRI